MSKVRRRSHEPTHYLNVDLDIVSLVPLDGLVQAMGDEAFVLYVGRVKRRYEAHVELASSHMSMSADRTILGLARLVSRLPDRYRKIWSAASSREFNIGIEAGVRPQSFELRLSPKALEAVRQVGGTLVVTVYERTRATRLKKLR